MLEIKVLGPGCAKCKSLYAKVVEVVKDNAIDANVEKVEDIQTIISYGILMTPGLVVNGKVKLSGSVPKEAEILAKIREEM